MELFDKFYNCYYLTVNHILEEAARQPVTRLRMEELAQKYGYGESAFTIVPKLMDGEWPLLQSENGKSFSPVCPHISDIPLTTLQKSWLKALLADRRIRLFLTEEELAQAEQELSGIEPLFSEKDFHYFDRYLDGDDYASPLYRENFHTILEALEQQLSLEVTYRAGRRELSLLAAPYQLQYSSKDDKFRLCCLKLQDNRFRQNITLNLSRIKSCRLFARRIPERARSMRFQHLQKCAQPVLLEISGERNSLERCMLHFANYEKHTEYDEERGVYLCSIFYDQADETELLISVLSFGPVVRVLGPEPFLAQIRQRVMRQHSLFYDKTD